MKRKLFVCSVFCLIAILYSLPLEAQLKEAAGIPWPGFQVLKGRWQAHNRTGVIDVKGISTTGGVEMRYFDTEPIHVTQAQAARDGKLTKILIILRYPNSLCCTYDLIYDPQNDRLKGILWQEGISAPTEVIFHRKS